MTTLELLERNVENKEELFLTVIGHSLDETDKDIIQELFRCATHINVLYYNSSDLSKYMKNLVNIYGKRGFDELRYKKDLTFTQLSVEIENGKILEKVFDDQFLKALEN